MTRAVGAAGAFALGAVLAAAACSSPSARVLVATTGDAGREAGGGCLDAVALCKANNVACGPLLARDTVCGVDVHVDCGLCGAIPGAQHAMVLNPRPYLMGNGLPTAPADERPAHVVQLASFAIDRREVSVRDYAACVAAKACEAPGVGGACNYEVSGRETHPINCVDWLQANAYCSFVGMRLPTEEEWEYVARNGEAVRLYPWGNLSPSALVESAGASPSALCWASASGMAQPSTCANDREGVLDLTREDFTGARTGLASARVQDLAANVREWTVDGASPSYDSPRETRYRIVRGGGWFVDASPLSVNSVHRNALLSVSRLPDLGFRCVVSLPPSL